jgi:hypothetical protein
MSGGLKLRFVPFWATDSRTYLRNAPARLVYVKYTAPVVV